MDEMEQAKQKNTRMGFRHDCAYWVLTLYLLVFFLTGILVSAAMTMTSLQDGFTIERTMFILLFGLFPISCGIVVHEVLTRERGK